MPFIQTDFDKKEHGFLFHNNFTFPFFSSLTTARLSFLKLKNPEYGLCGGMCFTALDFFYASNTPPRYKSVNEIDLGLFSYLWERQIDSMNTPMLVKMIANMIKGDGALARLSAHDECELLRNSIDHNEPQVIVLIRERFGNPMNNHQVIVMAYESDELKNITTLHIYDPNKPFNPTKPEKINKITINNTYSNQGIQIRTSENDFLRGFFVASYKQKSPL